MSVFAKYDVLSCGMANLSNNSESVPDENIHPYKNISMAYKIQNNACDRPEVDFNNSYTT